MILRYIAEQTRFLMGIFQGYWVFLPSSGIVFPLVLKSLFFATSIMVNVLKASSCWLLELAQILMMAGL